MTVKDLRLNGPSSPATIVDRARGQRISPTAVQRSIIPFTWCLAAAPEHRQRCARQPRRVLWEQRKDCYDRAEVRSTKLLGVFWIRYERLNRRLVLN